MDCYDYLPAEIRRLVAQSPFNLCPACLQDIAHRLPGNLSWYEPRTMEMVHRSPYPAAVDQMEATIRDLNEEEDQRAGLTAA